MDIIGKKWFYFLFSGLVIVPGIISLILWGVKPSIDFTGGTLLELKFENFQFPISNFQLKQITEEQRIEVGSIQQSGEKTYLLRLKPIDKEQNQKLQEELNKKYGKVEELRFEAVGPVIGKETTIKAIKAVIVASFA